MQYWIKDFNEVVSLFIYFEINFILILKLIWIYIFYKIFLNLYLFFIKSILIDFIKFFRLYSLIFIYLNKNYHFKSYFHLIFYFFDYILSLLFYLVFYFWIDFLWFFFYDFKWWWRKTIKTNIKVYMKDELDPELSKIFYVHHGIHFINRLKFISLLRFIYFWFYLLYYYLVCFFKIYLMLFFKNYYYILSLIFFSYKLNWLKKTYILFFKLYIYCRNAVYYLLNSYFGFLSFNWYKKYEENTFEISWVERLAELSKINQRSFSYLFLDFFLPWSLYKKHLKFGNKVSLNILSLIFYVFNLIFLQILKFLSITKLFSYSFKNFQFFIFFKLNLLRLIFSIFNFNLVYLIFSIFSFFFFLNIKIIYIIYKNINNIYVKFFILLNMFFIFFEYIFVNFFFFLKEFFNNILLMCFYLINYLYIYRLFLIVLLLFFFINLKYIIIFFVYIVDWFFNYYIVDWFLLPDFLFSIGDSIEQSKYLIESIYTTINLPLENETKLHNIFLSYYNRNTWLYLFLHIFTFIERFFQWQFSRIWTIKIFVDWDNVYWYKLFCYTTCYKFCFFFSLIEYFLIDFFLEYLIDFFDWFFLLTKFDLIFIKIKTWLNFYFSMNNFTENLLNIFMFLEKNFFSIISFLSEDLQLCFWYLILLIKVNLFFIFEFSFYFVEYGSLLINKLFNIWVDIEKLFEKILKPFYTWMTQFPVGSNFINILLIKIYDFIFKYKLSIDGLLFDIEHIEQRTLKTVATMEKSYEILPSYVDGKSFYKFLGLKDTSKKLSGSKMLVKYKKVATKPLIWKLCYKKPVINYSQVFRLDPVDTFAWRDPEKGIYFFSARGIYTNWYTYRESFPFMKRISHLIDVSKSLTNKEIINLMDKEIILRTNYFFNWMQDIEYTIGNYFIWKSMFKGMKASVPSLMPEFYNHLFTEDRIDVFLRRYGYFYEVTRQPDIARKLNRGYFLYSNLFFFKYKNFHKFLYLQNPEYLFDFSLGNNFYNFANNQVSLDFINLRYWTKFFIYREYYTMDNFLWLVLSSRQTLHNFHFFMLGFFPLFFFFIFFFSDFKFVCFYNSDNYGDVRFWWRRFREQSLDEMPWVTETLSKEVFKFFDDNTKMLLKKGKNFVNDQSPNFFNKRPYQIARWTLLKKYKLLDKREYFKDFVLGKNFSLFHTLPKYDKFWDIRFNSIQDTSNFDLLLAYGFSRETIIKNLVYNDFVDFEELDLKPDYEKFKLLSDKFINLCFILDRDFFNFSLPGSAYHKDIQTFSYMKTPDGVYLITDTLPYLSLNFQYWVMDVLAFFIAFYTFRLGLHDNRLALNEYTYFFGTLFAHTDISFYWNSYWFGLHWFHFNSFNVEQWPISHDFRGLKFSKFHSINALYYGPISVTFDFSFNQFNIILSRFNSMSFIVSFYYFFNLCSFIFCLYFFNLMRIKLVTNKSLKINKNLFDLVTQSFFSIEYIFSYIFSLLGFSFIKENIIVDNNNIDKSLKNKNIFKDRKSLLFFLKKIV